MIGRVCLPPVACGLFTAAIALGFRLAWRPGPWFFAYNLPLAPPFAAFLLERGPVRRWRDGLIDATVVALALARVFVPPFPFVSGHVLFATYAALTARTRLLAVSAAAALAVSLAIKLLRWGDWKTPLGALVVATAAAVWRQSKPPA